MLVLDFNGFAQSIQKLQWYSLTLIQFEDERDQVFPQIYYRVRVVSRTDLR